MKTLPFTLLWTFFVTCICMGASVDPSSIQKLMERMDDSLVRGRIYQVSYQVHERKTDAYYANKNKLIKVVEEAAKNLEARRNYFYAKRCVSCGEANKLSAFNQAIKEGLKLLQGADHLLRLQFGRNRLLPQKIQDVRKGRRHS